MALIALFVSFLANYFLVLLIYLNFFKIETKMNLQNGIIKMEGRQFLKFKEVLQKENISSILLIKSVKSLFEEHSLNIHILSGDVLFHAGVFNFTNIQDLETTAQEFHDLLSKIFSIQEIQGGRKDSSRIALRVPRS